jgi:Aromatic-ring-opening dioxygenase LigAB, LigA subunit
VSHYATSRVMWEITRDRDLAVRFHEDPGVVLDGRDLDERERAALTEHDVRALFELGVHPFIVYHFALRLAGGWSPEFMQDYLGRLAGLAVGDLET